MAVKFYKGKLQFAQDDYNRSATPKNPNQAAVDAAVKALQSITETSFTETKFKALTQSSTAFTSAVATSLGVSLVSFGSDVSVLISKSPNSNVLTFVVSKGDATAQTSSLVVTFAPPVIKPKSLIVIGMGQSNMHGVIDSDPRGINTYAYSDKTPVQYAAALSVDAFKGGKMGSFSKLTSANSGSGGYNIIKAFAFKQAATENYGNIWVINTGENGSGFFIPELAGPNANDPNGYALNLTPFGRSYQGNLVQSAINSSPELKTLFTDPDNLDIRIFWQQGETDCSFVKDATMQDNYRDLVANYLSFVRDRLPIPATKVVPIIIGGMENTWATGTGNGGGTAADRQLVQDALRTLPSVLTHSAFADSAGAPLNSREQDWIHFGLTQLGFMADRWTAAIPVAESNVVPLATRMNIGNRLFGQFGTIGTANQPTALEFPTFRPETFYKALVWNPSVPNNTPNNYVTNQNFSMLKRIYRYRQDTANKTDRYQVRFSFFQTKDFSNFIQVVVGYSYNPIMNSGFSPDADRENDLYEVKSVRLVGAVPAFTKDNVDIARFVTNGQSVDNWTDKTYTEAFKVTAVKSGITFPRSGSFTGALGTIWGTDQKTLFVYDHITVDVLIPDVDKV